jgi:hypothetical protein
MALSQFLAGSEGKPEGQATFEIANLRPQTTGLPFVAWVSQRGQARHEVRVMVARSAKVFPSQMGVYSVRPFAYVSGQRLSSADENLLEDWISRNRDVLVAFWNADIENTEDMIEKIVPI